MVADRMFWIVLGVTVLLFLIATRPLGCLIACLTRRWQDRLPASDIQRLGLPGAGMWIGSLERLLIIVLVLSEMPELIGFILAAKSILRFPEIRHADSDPHARAMAEYVIIGTLLSLLTGLIIAFAVRRLWQVYSVS